MPGLAGGARLAKFIAPVLLTAHSQAEGSGPLVHTPLGSVRGVDYGDFVAFKGLPYAEKPHRFAAPSPKRPWNATLDATRFGDACVSAGAHVDSDPLESYGESEDCLFANVWVPKRKAGKLPVVVWIHGGGFIMRTGNYAGYWGDGLVTMPEAPVLLVTFNYRLGIFGFYSSEDTGANFALQDQQQLLRWTQQNIGAFGGDAERVLLLGQSAGAMSVLCHLASPGSRGLFQRAMASSPVGLHYRSPRENAAFVHTVAEVVGCAWAAKLTECLRTRPWHVLKLADIAPEYLVHWRKPCPECDNFLPWLPVVDGHVLPAVPASSHVPTILSSMRNETLAFVPTALMELGDNSLAYELLSSLMFKDRAAAIRQHYSTSPDTSHMRPGAELLGTVSTDALVTCYVRFLAKRFSTQAPAYISTFLAPPRSSEMHANHVCVEGPPDGAACHAGDINFMLPCSSRMTARTGVGYSTPEEAELVRRYALAIAGFAAGDQGPFERYVASEDVSITWELGGMNKTRRYHKSHCDFLEALGFAQDPWGSPQPLLV